MSVIEKPKTLVTVWAHPDSEQRFIIPGTVAETRDFARNAIALEHEDSNMDLFTGKEEWWTDEQLYALPDYEG